MDQNSKGLQAQLNDFTSKDSHFDYKSIIYLIKKCHQLKIDVKYPKPFIDNLIKIAKEYVIIENNLFELEISGKENINVIGSLHGQLPVLWEYLDSECFGSKEKMPITLFIGSYLWESEGGLSTFITLLCLKILYPEHFIMCRGKYDTIAAIKSRPFMYYMQEHYNVIYFKKVIEFFLHVSSAALINGKIFCSYAGFSPGYKLPLLNYFRKGDPSQIMHRVSHSFENWVISDFSDNLETVGEGKDGKYLFEEFLKINQIEKCICSQCVTTLAGSTILGGRLTNVRTSLYTKGDNNYYGCFAKIDSSLKISLCEIKPESFFTKQQ